jgi:hypothetical protein
VPSPSIRKGSAAQNKWMCTCKPVNQNTGKGRGAPGIHAPLCPRKRFAKDTNTIWFSKKIPFFPKEGDRVVLLPGVVPAGTYKWTTSHHGGKTMQWVQMAETALFSRGHAFPHFPVHLTDSNRAWEQ